MPSPKAEPVVLSDEERIASGVIKEAKTAQALLNEPFGTDTAPAGRRPCAIAVEAAVAGGEQTLCWRYSRAAASGVGCAVAG